MMIANMRAMKNTRIRSQAAESQRRGLWQEPEMSQNSEWHLVFGIWGIFSNRGKGL